MTGGDRGGHHLEPGFGITGLDRESVQRLGAEFEQDAVFWISAGILELVPCNHGKTEVLGNLGLRWLTSADTLPI